LALFDGRDFVSPDQIQELAVPVIAHRLVMEPQARFSGQTARSVVEAVLKTIKVPV
jgi:MoxR-like ATPase